MANKFEIQVVALDGFTKTFRRLNDQAGKAVRPLTNVQRQVGVLAREMHLDKIGKGMQYVQRSSVAMARSLGAISGPMESLFGISAAGGVAAGIASIGAAIGGLAANWGKAGTAVARNARDLNMTTGKLQEYQAAASLAGLSSEQMEAALRSLSNSLYSAAYDNDPELLQLLSQFHITMRRTASGAIDTEAALKDLADVIAATPDAHTQRRIADRFGIGELLPMLREGSAAFRQLSDEAKKLGMVMDESGIRKATEFEKSLWRLQGAMKGVSNAWGQGVGPTLARGMNAATDLMAGKSSTGATVLDALLHAFPLVGWQAELLKMTPHPGQAPRHKVSGVVTDAADSPLSFRDPKYDALDKAVESQLGLPQGLLAGVRLNGERSNANQVSEAGARSVYQITPRTRELALKRWGVDAYAGADSASQVAGLLLKDSMDRNGGDASAAVREYHGGTNPANWGPRTQAYVGRVMGENGQPAAATGQHVKVDVTFRNAPQGTIAEAKSGDVHLPTAVHYAMPTDYMPL